jgi:hypothetical protein
MLNFLKTFTHKVIHQIGYDIYNTRSARPVHQGSERMLGSFPPAAAWACVGRPENYFIHNRYCHRSEPAHYDATQSDRGWQQEVYQFAREICDLEGLKTICDIGCGSGFKLLNYCGDLTIIGIELPRTCNYLRKRHPKMQWMEANFDVLPSLPVDLVICADVIEHVPNPDELLLYIKKLSPRQIVLSTPDRNLLRFGRHNGPPLNLTHMREWSFAEFEAYIGHHFEIEEHFISFPAQATQCVLCRPRTGARVANPPA